MAGFQFKSFQSILRDAVALFLSQTGVTDINPGSVVTTFVEAPSQEAAQEYFQMYQTIRNYNLDTTEGTDLDNRAAEYDLERIAAQKASDIATIIDPSITKRQTNIYTGSRGPVAGQTYVDADSATDFDASGSIIVGRNSDNAETVAYSSITSFGNFDRFNLSGALTSDHGSDESIIQSQGGDRFISLGTVVYVPASDVSDKIEFITSEDATILDGESQVTGINIEAVFAGSDSNVAAGTIINFDTSPFIGAEVTNPKSITNGRDRETDDELRDRIRDTIQSLSNGVKQAILTGVINLEDSFDNKRIVSASLIQPTTLDEIVFLYIDDGTGLEPSFQGVGQETVIESATGGEKFLQLDHFPVIKAQVETINQQPYSLTQGQTLIVSVNNIEETITFQAGDFTIDGSASTFEITEAINARSSLIEARTSNNGTKVVLRAISNENEQIRVVGGTANSALGFPTKTVYSLELYKFNGETIIKLSKDGSTAFIECSSSQLYNLSGTETLTVVVDGKSVNTQTITFQSSDFLIPGLATAQEVVDRINLDLAGATATTTSLGQKITITSNTERSSDSKIQVTGGTANAELNFDTSEVVGSDKDYTLNRFNGQIELEEPADIGFQYTAGSSETRGFIISTIAEPYVLLNGDSITISVDGGSGQTATFTPSYFVNISQATAEEVANAINLQVDGVTASATADSKILIRTNTWDDSIGSIEITAVGGTATVLGFDVGVEVNNLIPHSAYQVSNTGPYSLVEGDNLVVVIDQSVFNIILNIDGTTTIGDAIFPYATVTGQITSLGQNFSTKFPNDGDLVDFNLKWLTGANAGDTSVIIAYNGVTGAMTISPAATNPTAIGDTFTIIPTTAKNIVTFLSNLITSSLANKASISLAEDGTKVQISSLTFGTAGLVQVTGGTANAELGFSTVVSTGRDGYEYYTGIVQEAQITVDGLDSDLINYPGIAASGIQVEVLPPVVKIIRLSVDLSFSEEADQDLVKDKATNLISSYINTLKVGQDLILTELVNLLMDIDGVSDVGFNDPTQNVPAADNEIIRIARDNIIIG